MKISTPESKKLNFGSGPDAKQGFHNVDIMKMPQIEQSFDFDEFPYPLKKNHFEYVLCNQILEHLMFPRRAVEELRKSCKNGAIIEIHVPYVGSKSAYSDMDHIHFFNDRSLFCLVGKDTQDQEGNLIEKFRVKSLYIEPQRYLKWLHPKILKILAVFLNNIYVEIHAKIEVVK